jgi:hypothetical protein
MLRDPPAHDPAQHILNVTGWELLLSRPVSDGEWPAAETLPDGRYRPLLLEDVVAGLPADVEVLAMAKDPGWLDR